MAVLKVLMVAVVLLISCYVDFPSLREKMNVTVTVIVTDFDSASMTNLASMTID